MCVTFVQPPVLTQSQGCLCQVIQREFIESLIRDLGPNYKVALIFVLPKSDHVRIRPLWRILDYTCIILQVWVPRTEDHSPARPFSRGRKNHFVSRCQSILTRMSSVPPNLSPLRLPRGEIVFYPTGRPSIRVLTHTIAALGYEVSGFPLSHTDLRPLPPGVWHWAVVLGEFILFIVLPPESAELSSDQSSYQSKDSPYYDSDNVDPDAPWLGRG